MGVWKDFCRLIESKPVRRHFGDLVPLVERCAIFEFTAEQIDKADRFVEPVSELEPVPPFPFPQMCLLGPGGVLILKSPEMDEETGVLQFETIAGYTGKGLFQRAICTVETKTLPLVTQVSDSRGVFDGQYFDADTPPGSTTAKRDDRAARVEQHAQLMAQAREAMVSAKRAGDIHKARRMEALIADAEQAQDRWLALLPQLDAATEEVSDLGDRFSDTAVVAVGEVFQTALRQVNWINKPDHYTVEIGPSAPPRKRKKKGDRATRLGDRTRHIVLTKHEIAEAWHRVHRGGTHASPLPHLRRGHYRTLLSDRYKQKRRVWVRATHVNGQCVEWRDGDVRYKVV